MLIATAQGTMTITNYIQRLKFVMIYNYGEIWLFEPINMFFEDIFKIEF